MTALPQENTQVQAQEVQKQNDKEFNFAQIRQQLERERQEKIKLSEEVEKLKKIAQTQLAPKEEVDTDDDEPYVDHKNLEKKLKKFEQIMDQKIEARADQKARELMEQHKQQQWMKNNPDFYDVMQHAQAFADKDPELAESILEMPEGFERQKLVYKNIKALGIHKPAEAKQSIQNKIDENRKSPYYQPTGTSGPAYGISHGGKNYSPTEQKTAFDKMRELQKNLRL